MPQVAIRINLRVTMHEERLTVAETAAELRITERALKDLCRRKRIGFIRISQKNWVFRRSDIEAFIKAHAQAVETPAKAGK